MKNWEWPGDETRNGPRDKADMLQYHMHVVFKNAWHVQMSKVTYYNFIITL